jgi:cell shape-determining protein MreD
VNRARIAAAIAAVLTALLLQATVVGPVTNPLPVSLPAVLIAAIALVDGPGAGIAFGFATGLLADLGSAHPAGVFALCWLGIGLICGMCATPRSRAMRNIVTATIVCGAASVVGGIALGLVGSGVSLDDVVRHGILATFGDLALALVVVPIVRLFLHSSTLRPARPVLLIGARQ